MMSLRTSFGMRKCANGKKIPPPTRIVPIEEAACNVPPVRLQALAGMHANACGRRVKASVGSTARILVDFISKELGGTHDVPPILKLH